MLGLDPEMIDTRIEYFPEVLYFFRRNTLYRAIGTRFGDANTWVCQYLVDSYQRGYLWSIKQLLGPTPNATTRIPIGYEVAVHEACLQE